MDSNRVGGGNHRTPMRTNTEVEAGDSPERSADGSVTSVNPGAGYISPGASNSSAAPKPVNQRDVSRGTGIGSWLMLSGGVIGGVFGLALGSIPVAVGGVAIAAYKGGQMLANRGAQKEAAATRESTPDSESALDSSSANSQQKTEQLSTQATQASLQQLQGVTLENNALKQRLTVLEQKLASRKQQNSTEQQALQGKQAALQLEVARLEQKASSLVQKNTSLKKKMSQRLDNKRQLNAQLERDKQQLQTKLQQAAAKATTLSLQDQELLRQNQELRRIDRERKQDISTLSGQLEQTQGLLERARSAESALESRLNAMAQRQPAETSESVWGDLNPQEFATDYDIPSSPEQVIRQLQGTIVQLRGQIDLLQEPQVNQPQEAQEWVTDPDELQQPMPTTVWNIDDDISSESGDSGVGMDYDLEDSESLTSEEDIDSFSEIDSGEEPEQTEVISTLKAQLSTLKAQRKDTQLELEKTRTQLQQVRQSAQQQLKHQEEEFEGTMEGSRNRNERLNQQLNSISKQLDQTQQQLSQLQEDYQASLQDQKKAEASARDYAHQAEHMDKQLHALADIAGINWQDIEAETPENRQIKLAESLKQSLVDAEHGRLLKQQAENLPQGGRSKKMTPEQYLNRAQAYGDFWREIVALMDGRKDAENLEPSHLILSMKEWVQNKEQSAENWESVCKYLQTMRPGLTQESIYKLLMNTRLPSDGNS